jgi:competence protein ComGC
MNKEKLKKELHQLIDETEDEALLSIVKEDIVAYKTKSSSKIDDLSDLSEEDRKELEEQAKEDPFANTITHEEFKQHISKWLTK